MNTPRLFTQETTPEVFEKLKGLQRHLFIKHQSLLMPGDKIVISQPDSREQLTFTIEDIEHGPSSKHVNGHYSLLGLYAPYNAEDDVKGLTIGGPVSTQQ